MRIFSFDPGAKFTGLATTTWYGQPELTWNDGLYLWQHEDPAFLYDEMMDFEPDRRTHVLVEDYSHGGAFTAEAKQTLEVVGFLTTQAARDGFTVVRRHKDKRLSGQAEAARLLGNSVAELKKEPKIKDAFSALSHLITYTREVAPE